MDESLSLLQDTCKNSLKYLCTDILGYSDWDTIHNEVEIFLRKPSQRKAILLPRNHLKTSIITIGFTIQQILKNPNIRILIVNQVWDVARNMLYQIKEVLESKSQLPKIFGNFRSPRWNAEDVVVAQRTIAVKEPTISTSGIEAETTGGHFDLIICDDLMGTENTQTFEQREKVKRKRRSYFNLLEPNGLFLDVCTRWHLDDYIADVLTKEKDYYDTTIRQVVENGKIIFPLKFSKVLNPVTKTWTPDPAGLSMDYINYLKASLTTAEFNSQYLNNPVDEENQIFRRDYFKYFEKRPDGLFVTMAIDPAISEKSSSDYSVISIVGKSSAHDLYVLDSSRGRWKLSDLIENIFTMYRKWKPSVIGMETHVFQKALKYAVEEKMRVNGTYFPITELKRNTNQSKEFRIKGLEPFYREGKVFHSKWMKNLEEELITFPKGVHDDELDCLANHLELILPGDEDQENVASEGTWEWANQSLQAQKGTWRNLIND